MNRRRMLQTWKRNYLVRAAIGFGAFAVSAIGIAAPFAITYQPTLISNSTFPEIADGQAFTVTLVVDNGGSSAANQAWTGSNLRCVIFMMNVGTGAGGGGGPPLVTFTQDLAATIGTLFIVGSMATGPGGALTSNFSEIDTNSSPPPGTFSSTGFTPLPNISWSLNSNNPVFFDQIQFPPPTQRSFSDATGGVQMATFRWTSPQPFSGSCPTVSTSGRSTSVPTMSEWTIALLAVLLGISGLATIRRRLSRSPRADGAGRNAR